MTASNVLSFYRTNPSRYQQNGSGYVTGGSAGGYGDQGGQGYNNNGGGYGQNQNYGPKDNYRQGGGGGGGAYGMFNFEMLRLVSGLEGKSFALDSHEHYFD